MLESLKSEEIYSESKILILDALCNLIFMGNIRYSVEDNPYTIAFLNLKGDAILDEI